MAKIFAASRMALSAVRQSMRCTAVYALYGIVRIQPKAIQPQDEKGDRSTTYFCELRKMHRDEIS